VYGVSSFVYRSRRPFHPERFADLLRDLPRSIVRSKGTAWLATNEMRVSIAQAGPSVRATAQGPWIASLPEVERDMYRSNRPNLEWHDEHGDRRTELVFIGTDYDESTLRRRSRTHRHRRGAGDESRRPLSHRTGRRDRYPRAVVSTHSRGRSSAQRISAPQSGQTGSLEVDVPDPNGAVVTPVGPLEPSAGRSFGVGDASAAFTDSMSPIVDRSS